MAPSGLDLINVHHVNLLSECMLFSASSVEVRLWWKHPFEPESYTNNKVADSEFHTNPNTNDQRVVAPNGLGKYTKASARQSQRLGRMHLTVRHGGIITAPLSMSAIEAPHRQGSGHHEYDRLQKGH